MKTKIIIYFLFGSVAILLISFRLHSFVSHLGDFIYTLNPIINYPFATYDQKMTMKYPSFYPIIMQIRNSTPSEAIIYIPDADHISNKQSVYFSDLAFAGGLLYPRNVIRLSTPDQSDMLIASWSGQLVTFRFQ